MKQPLKLWAHEYELSSPWHGPSHKGMLVKIEWPKKIIGYADVHPWPELGDDPLDAQIKSLTDPRLKPMMERAVSLAWLDGVARREGRSLYKGFQVPFSHYLLPDLFSFERPRLMARLEEGYQIFKCKMGGDLKDETAFLRTLVEAAGARARWRIDFNGKLEGPEFEDWATVNQDLLPLIDGIEDPVARQSYSQAASKFTLFADRVRLGNDWNLVIKPEIQETPTVPGKRIWYTNNLGHPFGHGVAMAMSARAGTQEICGLQGLQHYSPSVWTETIRYYGPVCLPPVGTGFGFDQLLPKLSWKLLG